MHNKNKRYTSTYLAKKRCSASATSPKAEVSPELQDFFTFLKDQETDTPTLLNNLKIEYANLKSVYRFSDKEIRRHDGNEKAEQMYTYIATKKTQTFKYYLIQYMLRNPEKSNSLLLELKQAGIVEKSGDTSLSPILEGSKALWKKEKSVGPYPYQRPKISRVFNYLKLPLKIQLTPEIEKAIEPLHKAISVPQEKVLTESKSNLFLRGTGRITRQIYPLVIEGHAQYDAPNLNFHTMITTLIEAIKTIFPELALNKEKMEAAHHKIKKDLPIEKPISPRIEGSETQFVVKDYGHPGQVFNQKNLGHHVQFLLQPGYLKAIISHFGHTSPELGKQLDDLWERSMAPVWQRIK